MATNRGLRHSEKFLRGWSSEKGRDRANAYRAIEGLSQGDAMLELLLEQNNMLRYMCDQMYRMRTGDTGPN